MQGTDSQHPEVAQLRRAWAAAPPVPDLGALLTPDVLAHESRLRNLIHLDVLERRRLGEPAELEHYRDLLRERAPNAMAPGTELARLVIRLERLMSGEEGGTDCLDSLRQRLGSAYAGDVSLAVRGAGPSMAAPGHRPGTAEDESESRDLFDVAAGASLPRGERLGDWIGPYRLLDVIGEGGFGVVYHAEQREPIERHVALKLIKPGMDTRSVLARFEQERQTLALLRHDHIAAIYDAGATERGRPYFVMELVRGEPITRYCDRHRLTTRERLELFIPVCRAVHHAHQKGIIHRDLSPDNILVEVRDGRAVPKIIDFGVAKAIDRRLTERTMSIERGMMIGKPEYMSPEQAEMTTLDIDTTTDIYSLGVILYEVLAGVLPLDRRTLRGRALDEMIAQIRYSERPTPQTRLSTLDARAAREIAFLRQSEARSLSRELGGRVQYLPMKALRADRTKRFSSAEALARDIEHYLAEEDFDEAAQEPRLDRARRFVKRNRAPVATAALATCAMVLGVGGTAWQAVRATRAEGRLTQERNVALAAQAEEQKRAEELEKVVDFQASQLSEIDTAMMGAGLRREILAQRRAALQVSLIEDASIESALKQFDESLNGVNFTNIALRALDENIFKRALAAIDAQFADQPIVQARLLQTVAKTLSDLGLRDQALGPQSKALAIRRDALGGHDPNTLTSINNMGLLLQNLGRFDEAMPYYREALDVRRAALGNEHSDTLVSINNMGGLLLDMGRFEEAIRYFHEVLEVGRRNPDVEQTEMLVSINNMGGSLRSLGRFDEALPYFQEALDLRRTMFGNDDRQTLTSINNMGALLFSMGRLDEALPYFREALSGRRRTLGDEHPETLVSVNNMAVVLRSMERFEEAMPYYREAVEGSRRSLPEDHPETLRAVSNMGSVLQALGRFEDALPYFDEALDGRLRTLGDDHHHTLISIANMGSLRRDLGQFDEADRLGAEAIDKARRVLPPTHRDLAVFLEYHARTLAAMRRFAEAEAEALEAHSIFEAALGPEHARAVSAVRQIADLYGAWHAAEPDKGYDLKAAQWRSRLDMPSATDEGNEPEGDG